MTCIKNVIKIKFIDVMNTIAVIIMIIIMLLITMIVHEL